MRALRSALRVAPDGRTRAIRVRYDEAYQSISQRSCCRSVVCRRVSHLLLREEPIEVAGRRARDGLGSTRPTPGMGRSTRARARVATLNDRAQKFEN